MLQMWIDTHAHLDAAELYGQTPQALLGEVGCVVVPAVLPANFDDTIAAARRCRGVFALGTHPLFAQQAGDGAALALDGALAIHANAADCVAVGEIGLDLFVPALREPPALALQTSTYRSQLKVAKRHQLPVLLHVRKSADQLLKGLREVGAHGGIAHAFNGSWQQACAFVDLGFKLGFGGALTYDAATHLRELARRLPLEAIVLETDSPDIVPQWLYTPQAQRAAGMPQGVNTPAELPRIAQTLADLRRMPLAELQAATAANACAALPKLGPWLNSR